MQKGTIIKLGDRQSGWIKLSNDKEDLFFHADALKGVTFSELHEGDVLAFSVTQSNKGPYAEDVSRIQ